MAGSAPLLVLEVFSDPAKEAISSNPYTSLLARSLPQNRVEAVYFSWKLALTGKYDIVHIHWPEQLLRHEQASKRLIKKILALAFLTRLRLSGKPVVRTAHNSLPHEQGSRVERYLLGRFEKATTAWIIMNSATQVPTGRIAYLIPHGHYRDWFDSVESAATPGRLLSFGLIRPYKGTDRLIHAFRDLRRDDLSLHIVGKPLTEDLRIQISNEVRNTRRVHALLEFVSDSQLTSEISTAEVVVLPYMQMGNSGAALLALSLHRPVLLPDTPSTRLLLDEFGPQWVSLFTGDLTSISLAQSIDDLRSLPRDDDGPDMSARDWGYLGEHHAEVFEKEVARKSR